MSSDAAAPAPKPSAPRKQIAVPGVCLVAALTIWAAGLGTESALAHDATQSVAATARGSTSTGEAGHQKNALFASSYFDKYGPSSEGEWIPWIEEHISLITAFPPVGDWYVSHTKLPVIGYHDVYTGFTNHGTIPLTPAIRAEYVAEVQRDASAGYAGTFMDDINFAGGNKPDPEVQSEASYRKELANLIEDVRTALGPQAIVDINAQYHDLWPLMKEHEPEVERALGNVDIVHKEFGVEPESGITTPEDYKEFTEYVDQLHERHIHVVMSGDLATVPAEEFNLATYFLNNDGGDYVTTVEESPENWWPGHDIKLGVAVSPRERESSGLWKRTFTEGVAYTLEPGATSDQTVKSSPGSTWLTIEGREVTEVTLAPGTGAVLRYAAREHEHHRHHGECADGTREGRHGRSDRREGRHGRSDRREGRHGRSDRRDHAHAAERSRRGR